MTNRLIIDGNNITLPDVYSVAVNKYRVELSIQARSAAQRSRELIENIIESDRPVYGVNTGFGKLSDVMIDRSQLRQLQTNLIRSHACGTGPPLNPAETRAALLIRANVLAKGFSGVRTVVIDTILQMLNAGVLPLIPSRGSVGASGDLAPSAHMALVMMGEGRALWNGREMDGGKAMDEAGIKAITFEAKEGLALLNGTQVMSAVAVLQWLEMEYLLQAASVAAALTTDGLKDTDRHFDKKIHEARPHPGQARIAAQMREILADSEIRDSHRSCPRVQDPYSLRCIPQVHGAVWDTMAHGRNVLQREINSATDNPLAFPSSGEVISGGNFHGEPVAFVCDFLGIAATELASISERRLELLLNPDLSGLPAFLTGDAGLNSGLMITQLTVVSLLSECRVLSHPASVDSLPTSANKEDHVSMGMTAALKLRQIVENVRTIIAIEFLAAAQAIDFRKPLRTSTLLTDLHSRIRQSVPFLEEDRDLSKDISAMDNLLKTRALSFPAITTISSPSDGIH